MPKQQSKAARDAAKKRAQAAKPKTVAVKRVRALQPVYAGVTPDGEAQHQYHDEGDEFLMEIDSALEAPKGVEILPDVPEGEEAEVQADDAPDGDKKSDDVL